MTQATKKFIEEKAQKSILEITYGEMAYIRKKYKLVEEISEEKMPERMSKKETARYYTEKLNKVWEKIL